MESKKNVLLLTYYWPPSGGAGVHRWLRFSRYFGENNCDLTVYCPKDAAWQVIDEELLAQVPKDIKVVRRSVFEPHKYLGKKGNTGIGFTQKKKASILKKMIIWIRGNVFIPDSRMFWIRPSKRFLHRYLREHPEIDTIISSGPPHSLHVIAQRLKKANPRLKWIADFRDPWTQIDFYDQLQVGKWADNRQKRLEKKCLVQADEVVTVSEACAKGLENIASRDIHVVTNGFIFPEFDESSIALTENFTITHFGSMPFSRNPLILWKALGELVKTESALRDSLKITLVGTVDYQVIESLRKHNLNEFLELIPPIKHSESIEMQRRSQLLLLVANNTGNVKGILTGKFFEYLGAKRPILSIGLKGSDLNKAVINTQSGHFNDFDDLDAMKQYILESFSLFTQGNLSSYPINIEQYSSKYLAKKFIDIL